ncbi:MAG: acetate/propionate family kinase [Mycoplasmataceae bacterium]|nr:acetate/propionate family kinase [Mycoplasmataceae bacterium]
MKKILVINAGSSTIKWKLFTKELDVIAEGVVDRILIGGILTMKFNGEKFEREIELNSHLDAANEIIKDFKTHNVVEDLSTIEYVGNRVVQGGTLFETTTVINEKEIGQISDLSKLAPLHNPGAVDAINAFKKVLTNAKFTATFDTSFHTTIPALNHTYPINQVLAKKHNIKKYGAHGTSHRFITSELETILNKDKVTFVNMHIGNGASLCAVKDSKSIDTSMGLTPLAGVMMGTRSGDIDPSIHKYVMEQEGLTIQEFDTILNKESGVKGVSGISQDMRDVEGKAGEGNKDALFALDLYTEKIVDYISIYANKLGSKLDALVFTAGVGENSSLIRQQVIDKLHFAKIELIQEVNTSKIGDYQLISTPESEIPVYVIRTDEEILIAKDALEA